MASISGDRVRLRQALRCDRPDPHALRPAEPVAQGLDSALAEVPGGNEEFQKAVGEYLERRSMVNRYGERNIDLVSGFAENIEIPETFVDYSAKPREYPLSTVQTIVRVHTRLGPVQMARTTNSKSRCV